MTKIAFLALISVTVGCSVIDDFDHAEKPPLVGNRTCDIDNPCRGNQQQVNICVENRCVRPAFSGAQIPLTDILNGKSLSVSGTLVVDQDVRLRPSEGTLRIEADNFLFRETVLVDLEGSASGTVEFVARESMLIESRARFDAIASDGAQALLIFLARDKLYDDPGVTFVPGNVCQCLYANGGDEFTDMAVNDTPDCGSQACYRPN
ncbi:MAG: hypothetical protein VX589_12565 [Myxococcota bacterium]|nr:hypothetical protein [Myxococcota bacterium]